jgi:hypothetical protein
MQVPTATAPTLEVATSTPAPGATTAIATITSPQPGSYRINGVIVITGTAETQLVNLRLRANGVVVGNLLPTVTGLVVPFEFERVDLTAGNLDIQTVAAATAGSIYTVILTATKAG